MDENKKLADFTNVSIGLTLSGGGYRAAAFHLGTMDYLEQLDLLSQVKMLSTVSGGTFTGVKYTLSLVEQQSYESYFTEYYDFLKQTNLVERGLETLGNRDTDAPSGRHDITVSMAKVYADTFLKKKDGTPYLFGDILNANIGLDDVIFNSTEFRYGLAFRFQRCSNPRGIIGNQKIRIKKKDAEQIRMADIVTASSCFPGGFEPFAFPNDFIWPDGKIPESLQTQFSNGPIALMDGGVYDNQGLQSLLLAEERDPDDLNLDMFIISDVEQQSEDLYPYPEDEVQGGPHLKTIALMLVAFTALLFVSLVMLINKFISDPFTWSNFFLVFIPLLQVGIAVFSIYWFYKKTQKYLRQIPFLGIYAWKYVKNLTVDEVLDMISLRISSLFALAASVFMKRIRSLVYGLIYGDFRKPVNEVIKKLYQNKRVSNLIYSLQQSKAAPPLPDIEAMTPELKAMIKTAAEMPTTLWFDKPDQLSSLVISGQATLCYNLMKYVVRNFGTAPDTYPHEAKKLWDKLNLDWEQFNQNPRFLLNAKFPN